MGTVVIAPIPQGSKDTPLLTVDTSVDSKSPALAASVAILVKMGAPQPTFIDQKVAIPQSGQWLPNNLTIFAGLVNGKLVQVVSSAWLVAAFPYMTFDQLRGVGLVTPNVNTPAGLVLDHFTNEPPMVYDAHKVINGTGPNPGDFGFPVMAKTDPANDPTTTKAVGSQGIFGGE